MNRQRAFPLLYLVFPVAGVLASLLVPTNRLALRILVGAVVAGLGILAADAGMRAGDLRGLPRSLIAGLIRRPQAETAARRVFTAVLLMIGAAVSFSPLFRTDRDLTFPALITLLGVAVLWSGLRYFSPTSPAGVEAALALVPQRGIMGLSAAGALLLLLSGELAGHSLTFSLFGKVDLPGQALAFYGGIALLVMGLGGIGRIAMPEWVITLPNGLRPRRSWLRSEPLLMLVLFFAALGVRAWDLQDGLRLSVDEALAIDGITHYYVGAIGLVARPSEYISTLIMPQWQGEVIRVLGRSVTSLRLTSAIVGALTVVVTYALARDLFRDRRIGLTAALILLTFPPHVHFSRIALIHIADPLFGALGIWFLIRGLRGGQRIDWALAGVSLAMTQYFFEAGRLFFIPLVVTWLIGAIGVSLLSPRRGQPRVRLPFRGMFIALIALFLAAAPVYYAIFSSNRDASPRLTTSAGLNLILGPFQDEAGLTGEEALALAQRLLFPFSVYVNQPEIAIFYGGQQPLLLVYVVPWFLLGTAYLIWRWRSASVILVLWLLFTALTNALLRDSAVYARWHVVFPAVAVVTAVGLHSVLPLLFHRPARAPSDAPNGAPADSPRRTVSLSALVVTALTALIVIGQAHYYFVQHVPTLERQAREFKPYPDGHDAALRMLALPSFTDIYLISDPIPDINVPRIWVNFLTRADVATLHYVPLAAVDFTEAFIEELPADRHLALFIDSRASDAIVRAVEAFGCAIETSPYAIDPPSKQYVLCFVDRALDGAAGG